MPTRRTINYAAPPPGSFWVWGPEYDVVEWHDGSTLAFWQELHGLLAFLGDQGSVPPLGPVLLLLAACRDEWLALCIPFHEKVMEILGVGDSEAIPPEIKDTLVRGLKVVNDLPKDLRFSFAAKCLLVSALFEGGPHSLPRDESNKILGELAIHGPRVLHGCSPEMDARARFLRDLRALRVGLARHDGASLESRLRTGLENLAIQPAPVPDARSLDADSQPLLDRLMTLGGECGAAAAVAKRAIAMMNLPGSFGTPRDLPVGGISDITNRGTVDRLLPGELAWDDLVLAARLVHNEALYFRREIPPQQVAVNHTVLLDRGLRLWGTGRVLSLGVALGLRHHPALDKTHGTFECLAATHDGFAPVDLATPAGVYAALEPLVPAAGPNAFLTAWWNAAMEREDSSVPDLSLITAKEPLEGPETRGLLGGIAAWIHERSGRFRVLALGRSGDVEVREWSPGGIRDCFRGQIDLDEILPSPKPASTPSEATAPPLRARPDPLHSLLPIYALDRLPFLFPVIPQGSAILERTALPILGVTHNGRLMEWPQKGWGAQELIAKVPGRQHWVAQDEGGEPVIIGSGGKPGEPVRVFRYRGNQLHEIGIEASRHAFPRNATVSGGAVLLAYPDSVEALSLATGNRVAELTVGTWPTDAVLDYDGERIHLHDTGKKPALPLDGWPFGDPTWPKMFQPDRIAVSGGVLLLGSADTLYLFYPMELCWKLVNSSSAAFVDFEKSDLEGSSGVVLEFARLDSGYEAWLDRPRGLLHLLRPGMNDLSPWSILLTTSDCAAWNQSWELFSSEPRLRLPTTSVAMPFPLRILKGFLTPTQTR